MPSHVHVLKISGACHLGIKQVPTVNNHWNFHKFVQACQIQSPVLLPWREDEQGVGPVGGLVR
jgi:hypothetical protein